TEDLIAEVFVTPKDIGFVEQGMPVDVRISAFDFGQYGGIDGEIEFISSSSLEPEPPYDFFRYAVKVKLDQNYLLVKERKRFIQPGMEVQANVIINENRTVWNLMTDQFLGGIKDLKKLE
ncbi:MAG: HlyD family efflux transporter periplasmic adaptor subunit, partial [Cyanobacteria bacterium P01_C01_bin.72]